MATQQRPLMTLEDALVLLVQGSTPHRITQQETVSTFDGLGRVLAQDVSSLIHVPPQDNTAMDGYALRVADVPSIGVVGASLLPGTVARIFTGAQVPAGADAVVMQEQCEALGDSGTVRVNVLPAAGQWIRRQGEDVSAGAVVLKAGQRLTPQALGLAASVGAGQLQVLRKPRLAIFSTGDELQMPGEPLRPGAIYNSNRFTLRALGLAAGCEVTDMGIVPDRLDATRAALREAAAGHDVIVTCGGVSVGEEDHLKPAALAEGELQDWQLAIKPGKPLAFAHIRKPGGSALLVGLPGNPVSSFVTWLLAVGTVLRNLQGLPTGLPRALPLRAGFDWLKPDKRREFLRVRFNAEGALELFPNQSSGVLTSAVWADGLVDNPGGQVVRAGDRVAFLPLPELVAR
jgi:molybdopterin molybdotransferase